MIQEIDTVVRFHDISRLSELTRCIFSLANQNYRPIHIILAVQRFSKEDIATTRSALMCFIEGRDDLDLTIVNFDKENPKDARSVLLNMGISKARGKYIGFLDYDDVLYPEAYELLVDKLQKSGSAIVFASVRIMWLRVFDRFFYSDEPAQSFVGSHLIDLFRSNFCPLHSYLIDRDKVSSNMLSFMPSLTIEEDYDVLLRICARYPSDFSLIGTEIGYYYYKSDNSNTIPHDGAPLTDELDKRYKDVRATIEHRRRTTLVSPIVRQRLGLQPTSRPLTIRELVDRWS